MYSQYNIYNIQIKHLQYTFETAEIYTYNIYVYPLEHIQHQIYFLQYLNETYVTYIWNKRNIRL
jgi:hypothetical protein